MTPDPVARSTYTYAGANLTGLLHADPSDNVLREYDWGYEDARIVSEEAADGSYYTADRNLVQQQHERHRCGRLAHLHRRRLQPGDLRRNVSL